MTFHVGSFEVVSPWKLYKNYLFLIHATRLAHCSMLSPFVFPYCEERVYVRMLVCSSIPFGGICNGARLQCDGTCKEDNFRVWVVKMSTHPVIPDTRGRYVSSILAVGFRARLAHNGLTPSAVLFPSSLPSFTLVCAIT
jgi:hypothetical protein